MLKLINSSLMKFFLNIQEFSRTPEKIQGQHDVFQESRTKPDLIANSRTVLGAQGRLAAQVYQSAKCTARFAVHYKHLRPALVNF